MNVDMEELCRFLVKAKINTYASAREGAILRDGSKELVFSEGKWLYRDRYFGFNPFIGEETVFYQGGMCLGYELLRVRCFFRRALLKGCVRFSLRGIEKDQRKETI